MTAGIERRAMLKGLLAGGALLGVSGAAGPLLTACSSAKSASTSKGSDPIKIGALTDLTGAFGVVGKSNQAVARFTVDEINGAGGVLGRKLDLVVVDSASDPAVGATVARQLVDQDKVSMVIGGVASNMREAIKGIIAGRGKTLYIGPASYEGGECDSNVWSVGSAPNQQVDPTVEYLLGQGKKTFYLCGSDYVYPRNILARVRQKVEAGGGRVVGEQYIPLTATDTSTLISKVIASGADALFEVVVLPATPGLIKGVVQGGYKGVIVGTLFDEGITPLFGTAAQGLICVQDYYAPINDPFSSQEVKKFDTAQPNQIFASTFNSAAWYRGLYLWKAAVEKAGSLDLAKVNSSMDAASSDKLIGGAAAMKPGTRHCSLSMYLGQMQGDGTVKVLKSLGKIDPQQC
jgi:ABC-type branched-subunit amino acid transport system substrate-binding protein